MLVVEIRAVQPPVEGRHYPFSCGTQSMDWEGANCDRCKKQTPADQGIEFNCEIEAALFEAQWGDGTVSEDIARRMGLLEHPNQYGWPCGEVDWTEEWKAEYRRRHPEFVEEEQANEAKAAVVAEWREYDASQPHLL